MFLRAMPWRTGPLFSHSFSLADDRLYDSEKTNGRELHHTPLPFSPTPPKRRYPVEGAVHRALFWFLKDAMRVCDERVSSNPLRSPI